MNTLRWFNIPSNSCERLWWTSSKVCRGHDRYNFVCIICTVFHFARYASSTDDDFQSTLRRVFNSEASVQRVLAISFRSYPYPIEERLTSIWKRWCIEPAGELQWEKMNDFLLIDLYNSRGRSLNNSGKTLYLLEKGHPGQKAETHRALVRIVYDTR